MSCAHYSIGVAFPHQRGAPVVGQFCDKVSLTVTLPYDRWEEILALSMGGRAARMTDRAEIAKVGRLMLKKFPQGVDFGPEEADVIALFSVTPVVVSVLEYRNGFGHTELVEV